MWKETSPWCLWSPLTLFFSSLTPKCPPHPVQSGTPWAMIFPYQALQPPHNVGCAGSQAEQGLSKSLCHGAENRDSAWASHSTEAPEGNPAASQVLCCRERQKARDASQKLPSCARLVISLIGLQKTVEHQREKHCQSSAHPVLTCPLSTASL